MKAGDPLAQATEVHIESVRRLDGITRTDRVENRTMLRRDVDQWCIRMPDSLLDLRLYTCQKTSIN